MRTRAKGATVLIEILLLIVIGLCVLAAGFFSGSETAIISADQARLHAAALEGDRRASLAEQLLDRVEGIIGATLVGTNLAIATSTSLATVLVAKHVPPKWESLATTLIMTPLILVIGEIVPKSICRASADKITLYVARPLQWVEMVMLPVVWLVSKIADALLLVTGGGKADTQRSLSRQELVVLAELGQEQGTIDAQERRMLQSLLELNERPVSSAMAPFVDMTAVDINSSAQDVRDLAARTGYARFPVYQDRIDNIVGLVALVDILAAETGDQPSEDSESQAITPFIQEPVTFVPETMPIGILLRDLQQSQTPMVIAVDEHGGIAGLVTREDIVEEIVGDIHDERDREQKRLSIRGADTFECDGKMEIDDLNECLGLDLEKEGFETVAGLVMRVAGRIPQAGDTFSHGALRIEVLEAERRRVRRVRFVRSGEVSGDAQDSAP